MLKNRNHDIAYSEELYVFWFQEANKLLQPADKTLKTMAIEFAEYQVSLSEKPVEIWFIKAQIEC